MDNVIHNIIIVPNEFNNKMLETVSLYLDPASGSVLAQMIIAALVGVGISVKVFWFRIKSKLTKTS